MFLNLYISFFIEIESFVKSWLKMILFCSKIVNSREALFKCVCGCLRELVIYEKGLYSTRAMIESLLP